MRRRGLLSDIVEGFLDLLFVSLHLPDDSFYKGALALLFLVLQPSEICRDVELKLAVSDETKLHPPL
ncbi:hypothetical protein WS89_31125 [Burkholderia sp. MSMB1072]|nr:hypothetical protein WS89_31125 [Burkholderia sp. MSMB1072]